MRPLLVLVVLLVHQSRQAPDQPRGLVARRTGTFQDPRLTESSGVVASRTHPGLLWTINDSGHRPELFLTDTTGAAVLAVQVRGAVNLDWEALGRGGTCGLVECLFIGDIGDNAERRQSIVLYRLAEPGVDPRVRSTPPAEALHLRYPDRPHDAEALYVEPDGAVVLLTKGRSGGVLAFRVSASAWGSRSTVTAAYLGRLPIAPSLAQGRVVTDAGISRDGASVAIRTYRDILRFARSSSGALRLESDLPGCHIAGLEPQGEGLDWWDDHTLVLTSEKGLQRAGTISLVRCPSR